MIGKQPASRPPASAPHRVMDMHAPGHVPAGLKPQASQPAVTKSKHTFPMRLIVAASIGAVGVVMLAGGVLVALRLTSPQPTRKVELTANTYQVVDDPNGISFSISKSFTAMRPDDLKKMNPLFIYGFQVASVDHVACIISQTQRTKPTAVTPDQLGQGTYAQLKASFPDITPIGYQAIKLKNGRSAAELIVGYHDKGVAIKQAEVVAVTSARSTFAFCTSPTPLYGYYQPTFDAFFKQLKIY